jgi:hypothetical protein
MIWERLIAAILWVLLLGALISIAVEAHAHDMDDPDAAWYRSLTVPGLPGEGLAGTSCCNGGHDPDPDCKNVEVRYRAGHEEAFIDSKTFPDSDRSAYFGHAPNDWVEIPEKVRIHRDNPTGAPVACWYNHTIRCFVDGTGT